MLRISIATDNLEDALVVHGPRNVYRASKSAMGSAAYRVQGEVQRQIRGRIGWPGKRTRFRSKRGMSFWARFIKYRVVDAAGFAGGGGFETRGLTAVVGPAKDDRRGFVTLEGDSVANSKADSWTGPKLYRNTVLRDSPFLRAVFHRFEHGRDIPVTAAMRKRLAAAGMPVRKATQALDFQPRPIFGPARQRQAAWLPAFFAARFAENLARYQSGLSMSDWRKIRSEAR